jgi:hypothetical protein
MANDKPVTRKERFLAGAAGEDITLDTPITREERFLAKAAGMDVKTDDPVTRSEKYLAKIAEGGGGGAGLWDEEPPSDGKTRIYIDLVEGYKSPYLGMQLYSGASKVIDWGDGTNPEESTTEYNLHNYEHGGKYIITVEIKNANVILKGYLSSQIYASACGYLLTAQDSYTSQNSGNKNNYYANAVKKVYIGQNVEIQDGAFVNFQGLTKISLGSALIYGTAKKLAQAFKGCVNLTDIDLTQTNIKEFGDYLFQNCFRLSKMIVPPNLLSFSGKYIYNGAGAIPEIVFLPTTPPTASYTHSIAANSNIKYYIPFGSLAAYLTATNYPSPSTYNYIGFATYENGATLPTQDTTEAYNVVWYATKEDAIAQTNPITVGNGSEIYCRYTAV